MKCEMKYVGTCKDCGKEVYEISNMEDFGSMVIHVEKRKCSSPILKKKSEKEDIKNY